MIALLHLNGFAAIQKKDLQIAEVFRGGTASKVSYRLADLRWSSAQDRERLVFDIKSLGEESSFVEVPYLNVELRDSATLFVDMVQVISGELNQSELMKRLQGSRFIQTSSMTFVPRHLSMNVTLQLKSSAKVQVATLPGKRGQPARLVLDFHAVTQSLGGIQ